ncbi:tetratricopeptide repeat protein [Fusobacterium nucleatum]|uniref:tetratricopeptide repeat protein n=1 Tax=Fusobacterium nucleatum TaxID=851 RepID=UPI0030D1F53F
MVNKIEESYNKYLNLFKQGKRDTEEYRKELENLIDLTKNNVEFKEYNFDSKFRLAKFYYEKHQYDLSKKYFLELINDKNIGDFKLEVIREFAYNLRILKKYDEAVFWYEKLSELSNSEYYDEIVLEGLAKCSTMLNNFEKERENYRILLSNCLDKDEFKNLAGKILNLKSQLLNTTDLKREEVINTELIYLNNDLDNAYYKLTDIKMKIAKSYFSEKKYEDCRKEVQTIFEFLEYSISDMQDYAITNANMLLGKTYFEEGDFEKAKEYFEPIANTPKEDKYMISDIHSARNFLAKMK